MSNAGPFKVYLAGPITGASGSTAFNWRDEVKKTLEDISNGLIRGYSPLRGKEYLKKEDSIADSYTDFTMSTEGAIMTRDHHDVITSDVVFVNFADSERISIGTVMEIAWAFDRQIPIVMVVGYDNFHYHSMVRAASPFRVKTLEEGILVAAKILLP